MMVLVCTRGSNCHYRYYPTWHQPQCSSVRYQELQECFVEFFILIVNII